MTPMQPDWEMDDEAYEGPDAYVEGDEIEHEVEEQVEALTEGYGSSVQGILRSLFELQPEGADEVPAPEQARVGRISGIGLYELSRLLGGAAANYGHAPAPASVENDDNDPDYVDDDDDDEDDPGSYYRHYQRSAHQWFPTITEPQEAGVKLLMSGEFGRVGQRLGTHSNRDVTRLLRDRATATRYSNYKEDILSNLVPNTNGTSVASSPSNIYSGQFSKDSSFYYTCSQDFELRIYDMTAPPPKPPPRVGPSGFSNHQDSTIKITKTIQGSPGRWTITDSHLSPDNERMIYSSITPTIYMTSTLDSDPAQIPIRFADQPRRQSRRIWGFDEESFGIYSCRFSADGNEVVAGGSGKIFVYDLLGDCRTVKIAAHNDDVNSCCWADTASGNILVSASDDSFIKIWDRRSLGTSQKPSGVLVGHTEGITSVAAKGDGRYIISNGKDQALRLWDLRKMHSSDGFDKFSNDFYGMTHYDYRYGHYPKPKHLAHPRDCSVMTYRGHQVLQTLIRCQFSPAETTGSQYLYSGSSDGRIHIWSLDGRVVQVLDRSQCLPMSMDASGPEPDPTNNMYNRVCVRDVSWHSQEPVIMSVGWESRRSGSTVARHEWKGLPKMSGKLEDFVEKQRDERTERASRRAARRGQIPGAFEREESDDE